MSWPALPSVLSNDLAVLLASAVVVFALLAGLWDWLQGWVAQGSLEQRSELERVEARAATLRYRMDAWLRRTRPGRELEQRINAAGVELNVLELAALLVAVAVGSYLLVEALLATVLALLAGAGATRAVFAWLDRRRRQRRDEIVAQLPELARVMSNAASAGRSLPSAIRLAAEELDEPASGELSLVAEQLRVGRPLHRALPALEERVPSRDVSVLVGTLLIQHRAGGDLVRALRDISETLEGRQDLNEELNTLMAGSVYTGYIAAALGVGALLLLNSITPGVIDEMTRSWVGRVALLAAGGLYALGLVLIRRETRIEV